MNLQPMSVPRPSGIVMVMCCIAILLMTAGFFAGMWVGTHDARLMRDDDARLVAQCQREHPDGTAFRNLHSRNAFCLYGSHRQLNPKKGSK